MRVDDVAGNIHRTERDLYRIDRYLGKEAGAYTRPLLQLNLSRF